MAKVWNLEDIKNEIIKLDKLTGLCGANIKTTISTKMTKCKGKFCFLMKKKDIIEDGCSFKFSSILLDGRYEEHVVREVIGHEYMHYYCYRNYSHNIHHGKEFKLACDKYGINNSTYFKYETVKEYTPKLKKKKVYVLTCRNCNREYIYKTNSKVVKNHNDYRCKCRGRLKLSTRIIEKEV